jgi:hypothetical protein
VASPDRLRHDGVILFAEDVVDLSLILAAELEILAIRRAAGQIHCSVART